MRSRKARTLLRFPHTSIAVTAPDASEPAVASGSVAGFLTEAWIDDLDAAVQAVALPDDVQLVVQQIVTDADGDVPYVIAIADGRVRVHRGRAERSDVSFTQDRATAAAIARGELSAQVAFLDGRLRLGGDLRAVLARAGDLAALDDAFAAARAATEW